MPLSRFPSPVLLLSGLLLGAPSSSLATVTTLGSAGTSFQSNGGSPPAGEATLIEYPESSTVLDAFSFYLTLDSAHPVQFTVFESTDYSLFFGTFYLVWEDSVSAAAGTGFVSSGDINLPLSPSSTYLLAVSGLEPEDDLWYDGTIGYPRDAGIGTASGWITTADVWGNPVFIFLVVGVDGVDYSQITWHLAGREPDDADGDGYDVEEDCDDSNEDIHPGADEDCDDGVDNDCDGDRDEEDPECGSSDDDATPSDDDDATSSDDDATPSDDDDATSSDDDATSSDDDDDASGEDDDSYTGGDDDDDDAFDQEREIHCACTASPGQDPARTSSLILAFLWMRARRKRREANPSIPRSERV